MGVHMLTAAGLNVSALTINAGPGKESKIVLGEGPSTFCQNSGSSSSTASSLP